MTVVAIISEYNPFHSGHKYQIDKIREENNDDLVEIKLSYDSLINETGENA